MTAESLKKDIRPGVLAREEFPIFTSENAQKKPLAYLDSAASSQKPACVIDRISRYFQTEHANIHRGAYALSSQATLNYENARTKIADFINAPKAENVIFTRGTTESINLLSRSLEVLFRPGENILLSILEHHSNIVPWQMLAERKKLKLEFVDINSAGELDLEDLKEKAARLKPRLISVTQISNAIGSIVPINEVVRCARENGAMIMVDAAQGVVHSAIDVQDLDVDFLVFSGHKIYGPTGIGVLYGKHELLQRMTPFMGGGDMIEQVSVEGSTFAAIPQKFEAGTPPIAEAIALGTAIDFVSAFDPQEVKAHENQLMALAYEQLSAIEGIQIFGPITKGKEQSAILSFTLNGVHAHDFATVADTFNVQVRAGHHCAMPLMKRLGQTSTVRMSFGVYNTEQDVYQLLDAVYAAQKLFS